MIRARSLRPFERAFGGSLAFVLATLSMGACSGDDTIVPMDSSVGPGSDAHVPDGAHLDAGFDADIDASLPDPSQFCGMPGSIISVGAAKLQVPGAPPSTPDLGWVTVPPGFCVHHFANVPSARQVRFAPGGELFVSSPSRSTAGGAPTGMGAVVVVPDDDKDGVGDGLTTYVSVVSVEGLLFANNSLYYQDDTKIMQVPYASGQRVMTGNPITAVDIQVYKSPFHWPKTLDIADDGTIYVTNGGDQGEACVQPEPFHGGVLAIDGTPGGREVAKGFRNPQYMRCQKGHNNCFVNELTRDFSATEGGREKVVRIHNGDWGFPCCASANLPFPDIAPTPDCSGVEPDNDNFIVGSTPFGLDFEPGTWADPYKNDVYIALHGAVGTLIGARVVRLLVDPSNGIPLPADSLDGGVSAGGMFDFMVGWDDGMQDHGRPSDVTFSKDGRIFVSNDADGEIFWVAPVGLKHP